MAKKTTKSDEAQARSSTGQFIKEIRRNTAKVYTSEQKILIVMEGMRAELSVAELYIIIEKGSSFYLKSIPFRKDFQRT